MTRPRILRFAALAGAGLFALPACQTVNTAQREERVGQRDYVDDERVITDKGLSKKAQIVSINEARLANGRLKVQAQIQNRDKQKHTLHYRFEWLDDHGMVSPSVTSNWKSINIQGGQLVSVSATSSDSRVTDFRLELIERKPFNVLKNQ